MNISTAARLSSSFPFVTPTARSNIQDCPPLRGGDTTGYCLHIADGGYHDNYGVASLAEWLNEALSDKDNKIKNILIIQIRSSYISQESETKSSGDILLQNYSPAITLLNIRTAAQLANAETIVNLLRDKWNNKKDGQYNLQTAIFEYQVSEPPPLSWHMTRKDKDNIHEGWSIIKGTHKFLKDKNGALDAFKNFLEQMKTK
jgi:hypothetical protein